MMSQQDCFFHIIVIGAGPAGMAAAIEAGFGRSDCSIAVLEKKDFPGKKLSVTGNGRCNLSNVNCTNKDEVEDFFRKTGIVTKTDNDGRIYPYSEDAKAVVKSLYDTAACLNTEFILNCQVLQAKAAENGGFIVEINWQGEKKTLSCHKLLIAAGGKSQSRLGSSGEGYPMAKVFGHKITRLAPSLAAVSVTEDISKLQGVRAKGRVTLLKANSEVFTEAGEIQFNKDNISGICVLNMSGYLKMADGGNFATGFREYSIKINLTDQFTQKELSSLLHEKLEKMKKLDMEVGALLSTIVKGNLAEFILEKAGISPRAKAGHITEDVLCSIEKNLTELTLHTNGTAGWNEAQVTAGGVSVDEINLETMESKLVNGLFFAGEIIDYDGPCGGFNLHNAWLTGIRAGKGMIRNE